MSATAQLDIFSALETIDRTERTQHLPRTFTTSEQYTASDLVAAFDAWQGEHPDLFCGGSKHSHMWTREITSPPGTKYPHSAWLMDADLRCGHHKQNCFCVGAIIYRTYCSDCDWWSAPTEDEGDAIRDYHDHCWPGWRNLPVLTRPSPDRKPKLPDDYPQEWQAPGAPIVTTRTPIGTRNVPGRSPFGGYDMADPNCL